MKAGGECIWRGKEMERAVPMLSEAMHLPSSFIIKKYCIYFKQLKIIFPLRLLKNTEQNSVCCTVSPCW